MRLISTIIMGLYLGTAPVYWWPGIPLEIFTLFKLVLVSLAVISIWFTAITQNKFELPTGLLGPAGLVIILLASSSGIIQSSSTTSVLIVKDCTLSFIMLWTFYMYQTSTGRSKEIFVIAAILIAFQCFLVVTSKVFGIPQWSGPPQFIASELWISGFGGLRTGWSNGTSIYVPILIGLVSQYVTKSFALKLVYIFAALMIFSSCVIVGGRAGILASTVAMMLILFRKGSRFWFFALGVSGILMAIVLSDFLFTHLRFDRIGTTAHGGFGAGRWESSLYAIQLILEKPIFGYGFGQGIINQTGSHGVEFHNLWLKLAVESGLILPIILAAQVTSILLLAKKNGNALVNNEKNRAEYYSYIILLLSGLMITMLEPRFILGAFQLSAIWWAVAGAVIAKTKMSNEALAVSDVVEPVDVVGNSSDKRILNRKK